jgi:hypothetical protein
LAVADLFANMLAHPPLGPVVLIGLGMSLLLSAALHRRCTHHPARPLALPGAVRPAPDACIAAPPVATRRLQEGIYGACERRCATARAASPRWSVLTLAAQMTGGNEQGEPDGVDATTMRLGDPVGGALTCERATLAFIPAAEFARDGIKLCRNDE